MARSFMKHDPGTSAKFYVKAWSQRESARISMKCMSLYQLSSDAETYQVLFYSSEIQNHLSQKRVKILHIPSTCCLGRVQKSPLCLFLLEVPVEYYSEVDDKEFLR